jgi:hypothetical protein
MGEIVDFTASQHPCGRATGVLFSKGIGLGFNTFITDPEGWSIKPSP